MNLYCCSTPSKSAILSVIYSYHRRGKERKAFFGRKKKKAEEVRGVVLSIYLYLKKQTIHLSACCHAWLELMGPLSTILGSEHYLSRSIGHAGSPCTRRTDRSSHANLLAAACGRDGAGALRTPSLATSVPGLLTRGSSRSITFTCFG